MRKIKKPALLLVLLTMLMLCIQPASAGGVAAEVSSGGENYSFESAKEAYAKAVSLSAGNKDTVLTLTADWRAGVSGFGSGSNFENGSITVPGGVRLTIDLNGYTVDRGLFAVKSKGNVFTVKKGASLTIKDSNPMSDNFSSQIKGAIIKGGASTGAGGAFVLESGASLNVSGCTVVSCASSDRAGAVYIPSGASASFESTSFISDITYEDEAGAILCEGRLMAKNCYFEGCCAEEGGAIYTSTDEYVEITECEFYGNSAGNGGAVYINASNDRTVIRDCIFTENQATERGGAIFVNDDAVYLNGGTITDNYAREHGGGVYVDSFYDLNACGLLVIENNTDSAGASDLCLQNGYTSDAYLYCGGFDDGSHIGIDSTDDSSVTVCKEISYYQFKNYMFADNGTLSFKKDKVVRESFTASAIGKGKITFIIAGAVIFAAFAILVPVIIKRRNKADAD